MEKIFARMKPYNKKTQPHKSYTIAPGDRFSIRFRQGEFREVSAGMKGKLEKVFVRDDPNEGSMFAFFNKAGMESVLKREYADRRRATEREFFGESSYNEEREIARLMDEATPISSEKKKEEEGSEWDGIGEEMKEISNPEEDYFGEIQSELEAASTSESSEELEESSDEEEEVLEEAESTPKKGRKKTTRRS